MFKYCSVSFFLVDLILCFVLCFLGGGMFIFGSCYVIFNNYFVFDFTSFYLIILVLFLGVYSQCSFSWNVGVDSVRFLVLSLMFSLLCFCINHSILFWCFYELSMLPLLYLIFKESPYSERFLAGWYFSCYLLITSLPLVLILLYISLLNNSFFFTDWNIINTKWLILVILSFVFFTKVPLVPFHTWLPIVHAEATSVVSMFLSGYIMKLGLLGVYRCCYSIFDYGLSSYLFICFIVCVFFLVTASGELDGKRWLAFLSLSHIVVPFFAFFISDWSFISYSFFYCLGHGLSAGLVFGVLWYLYDLCNSRNWLLLKSSINNSVILFIVILSLLSLCSFPTTIQFFCEVSLVSVSLSFISYTLFWSFYLFFGGLVPLVLCGHLLIRSEFTELYGCDDYSFLNCLVLFIVWCYTGLLFI